MKEERDNSTAIGIKENGEEEPRVKGMMSLETGKLESYTVELLKLKEKMRGMVGR